MCAIWLPSLPAGADVLIESYRDERPVDADGILGPLRDELDKAGVKVRPADVISAAGEQLPLSGVSDPELGPSYPLELSGQVEQGTKQVFRGDYDAGLEALEGVLRSARENPALVVADRSAPAWLTKTYAAIAFAHLRKHQPGPASEAVAEQIRSFPDQPIGRIVGPEVATLSETVRKTLDGAARGTLRITVSRPDVQIYLDESERGRGQATLPLVAGTYRLLLVRSGESRRYSVVVPDRTPDRTIALSIDWDADAAFRATPTWIGLVWPAGQGDATATAAARYARGSRRHDLLVVSIVQREGRRFITGEVFEKHTGARLRRKAIELDRDDDQCERALAQYLVKGDRSRCLVNLPGEAGPAGEGEPTPGDPYLVSGLVAGAGAVSVIGGIAVLTHKQDLESGRGGPSYLSGPGVGLMIGGGLAIGVAAYLATRASGNAEQGQATLRGSRAPIYASAATAVAALVVGGYLVHLDGTGTCGRDEPGACYYRYGSAPHGWALIGTGIAATGFGVYWALSAPGDSQAPSVGLTPTRSGAMAGIGGRF